MKSAVVKNRDPRSAPHHGHGQLSPARVAHRPRSARCPTAPARRRARALAHRSRRARGGPGRGHPAGRPGHGGRRRRRRHRRRDPTRELLQPLRQRARGARPRQSRLRPGPDRPPQPGPARGRADPAHAAGQGARRRIRARRHRPAHPHHRARALHDEPAGPERPLPGRRRARAWTTRPRSTRSCATSSAAGADVVQIDEPYLQARPDPAREYALHALNRALEGIDATTALAHLLRLCGDRARPRTGYSFLAELDGCRGGPDLRRGAQQRLDPAVSRQLPEASRSSTASSTSATRPSRRPRWSWTGIRAALEHMPPERLVLAPDCGMKYLPRAVARGKLAAIVEERTPGCVTISPSPFSPPPAMSTMPGAGFAARPGRRHRAMA